MNLLASVKGGAEKVARSVSGAMALGLTVAVAATSLPAASARKIESPSQETPITQIEPGTASTQAPSQLPASVRVASDLIRQENQKPGTTAWFVPNPDQNKIAGYVDHPSYLPGDTARLFVDSQGSTYDFEVYRMGYYGKKGGRLVLKQEAVPNVKQPGTIVIGDYERGAKLQYTGWQPSATVPIGQDWVSGYYLVKLHNRDNGGESYAWFTVRSPNPAPVVVTFSTNTWAAYNVWGGLSLYRDIRGTRASVNQVELVDTESSMRPNQFDHNAHQVSFLRPYSTTHGAGQFFLYDRHLVAFLEAHGMPVSYATDTDAHAKRLAGPDTRLVILSGHSEYHTKRERAYYLDLRDRGVNLALFGGNDFVWHARYSGNGTVEEVWRTRALDPVKGDNASIRWEQLGWNQNRLTGSMQVWGKTGAVRAQSPQHWAWRGAGITAGTKLGQVLGHEYDGVVLNGDEPGSVAVLSRAPAQGIRRGAAGMTLVETPGRGWVFAANQIAFNWALSTPGITPPSWVSTRFPWPQGSRESLAIQRLVGNLIEDATGFENPVGAKRSPRPQLAPLTILVPAPGQLLATRPGQLMVLTSPPPAKARTVRIVVDGKRLGILRQRDATWVGPDVALPGAHRLTVTAVDGKGQPLLSRSVNFVTRKPSDPIFRKNGPELWRVYGESEGEE